MDFAQSRQRAAAGTAAWTASAILFCSIASAQIADYPPDEVAGIAVNYTEALAGDFALPDPLLLANGEPVRDAAGRSTLHTRADHAFLRAAIALLMNAPASLLSNGAICCWNWPGQLARSL